MLTYPDQELYSYLIKRQPMTDRAMQALMERIKLWRLIFIVLKSSYYLAILLLVVHGGAIACLCFFALALVD